MRIPAFVLSLVVLLQAAAAFAQDDLRDEAGFLRVTVGGRVVRLETLTVKRTDATGRLPIALITHGKPTTDGRALISGPAITRGRRATLRAAVGWPWW
jgi:hypothetical protein